MKFVGKTFKQEGSFAWFVGHRILCSNFLTKYDIYRILCSSFLTKYEIESFVLGPNKIYIKSFVLVF